MIRSRTIPLVAALLLLAGGCSILETNDGRIVLLASTAPGFSPISPQPPWATSWVEGSWSGLSIGSSTSGLEHLRLLEGSRSSAF